MKRVAVFVSAQGGGIKVGCVVRNRSLRGSGRIGFRFVRKRRKTAPANANAAPHQLGASVVALPSHAARMPRAAWHLFTASPSRLWIQALPDDAPPDYIGVPIDPLSAANEYRRRPGRRLRQGDIRMIYSASAEERAAQKLLCDF